MTPCPYCVARLVPRGKAVTGKISMHLRPREARVNLRSHTHMLFTRILQIVARTLTRAIRTQAREFKTMYCPDTASPVWNVCGVMEVRM